MRELIIGKGYNEKLYIGISRKYLCIMSKNIVIELRKVKELLYIVIEIGKIIIVKII